MGDDMESNMVRPSIHVPEAEEIFRIILDDCGYQSKTSDKGRYEAETVRKFGGLENAWYALWSERHRSLLMKFLDKSECVKGVHDKGVYLKDKRRYLNFASVSKIFSATTCSLLAKSLTSMWRRASSTVAISSCARTARTPPGIPSQTLTRISRADAAA